MASERIDSLSLPIRPQRARPAANSLARWWRLNVSERRILLMLGDVLMLSLALLGALWYAPTLGLPFEAPGLLFVRHLGWWLVLWGLWIPLAVAANAYDLGRAAHLLRSAAFGAACALVVALIYLLIPVVSAPLTRSRLAWFLFAGAASLGVGLWRAAFARLFAGRELTRRALVVGAGQSGAELARVLNARGAAAGIELVGFVDDDHALCGNTVESHLVLSTSQRLLELAQQHHVDDIVVAITDPHRICPALLQALVTCWERGLTVTPMALYFEQAMGSIPVEHVGRNLFALIDRQVSLVNRLWAVARRLLDIVLALIGLLILAPLLPLLALAIHLDCPGPLFYRQQRVGQGGRLFWLTKLRSMIPDAEGAGAVWACKNDDRITRVGRLLRKSRLDELPQLWNVFRGDMSLIGPRPERPEFVATLGDLLPYYAIRHSVKPGLTGWAQVRYRYGNSVEDSRIKLQFDLYYIKHRGPLLDLLILLHTVRIVLSLQGT
jgi:exopolysaccharide biosynthesis polyprenyl glycosylphosphotransferase